MVFLKVIERFLVSLKKRFIRQKGKKKAKELRNTSVFVFGDIFLQDGSVNYTVIAIY